MVGAANADVSPGVDQGAAYVFAVPTIPAVSTWGLVALLLLIASAGTVLLARKRIPAR